MSKSFLTSVLGGRISVPTNLPDGSSVIVRVEGDPKSPAQIGRWRMAVKAVTDYHNRHLEEGALPRHESEIHEALKRAFLGVEPQELAARSLRNTTRRELSEALSRLEAHYSGLGVVFDHPERYP